jgi:chorismate mutase/prephenate dehydratase
MPAKKPSSKEEIRDAIDRIDAQMIKLLARRAALAQQVIQYKKVYYDPARENQILDRLYGLNPGPLKNDSVKVIWREIMGACRDLQRPLTIAYMGPQATFSHAAVKQKFGGSVQEMACFDIPTVFDEVEKEAADFGVVPFENSTEGVINYTLDRFASTPLTICGEVFLDVKLFVLSLESDLKSVKRIYAHPKTIEQASAWLREKAADKEIIQVTSTGIAAQRAAEGRKSAAIASRLAAGLYGLKIIEQRVEGSRDNKTRFLVIGRERMPRTGKDKTSILFSVRHEPGTLYRSLRAFEKHGINLTMMQARPSRSGQWEYIFFVDAQGHQDDANLQKSLNEMKKETILLKLMGSYPEETR